MEDEQEVIILTYKHLWMEPDGQWYEEDLMEEHDNSD